MCNGGTKNLPIAVEGPTKKSVSDGMIESASMDIKYELKRAKNCTKRLDTSFINVAFDQLVGHQPNMVFCLAYGFLFSRHHFSYQQFKGSPLFCVVIISSWNEYNEFYMKKVRFGSDR